MLREHIAEVRRFNRLVTKRAGALEDHFLGRDRPLWESRLLFEIGTAGADLRDLRARLDLDSGYLSRLVRSLVERGLVEVRPAAEDERIRRAELTPPGRAELEEINRRSDGAAESLLEPLTDSQRMQLVTAMAQVRRLLQASALRIERVHPADDLARWCVGQYFAELAARFEQGFDPAQSLPMDDAELIPPAGAFLLARMEGEPVACGAVKTMAPGIAYLKRMWVSAQVRGLGVGRRMLAALESEALALGLRTVRLETNRALGEAIRLYRSAGYQEVPPFNDEPYADHWFEKRCSWVLHPTPMREPSADWSELRRELVAMAAEDQRVRQELAQSGALFEGYHPRMRAVHEAHAARMATILDDHGWPCEGRVGAEGAWAAWLIVQHAIASPALQRRALQALETAAAQGEVPACQPAMLEDRIRTLEGRPQCYGTQFDWDETGELNPLPIEDPDGLEARRRSVGLDPLEEAIRERRRETARSGERPPKDWWSRRREMERWLQATGWRE